MSTPPTESPGVVRLLLVDDDRDDYLLTRELLRHVEGQRCVLDWQPDAEAALAAMVAGEYHLYLLDYSLGARSGLEVLRRALAGGCRAPIIMLTGQGDSEVDLEAMRAGAADYLVKGRIDAPLLGRAVRYALERARTLEALRESEERYALAARGANDGLWDWNLATGAIYFSPRWKEMLGYREAELDGDRDDWFGRVHSKDRERLHADLAAHLAGTTPQLENEHRLQHKDGSFRWILCRGLAVRDQTGAAYRIAGSQTDITERKVRDALTGLPNRVLFLDRLATALAHRERSAARRFAVLFLDLDRFKMVNDSLGHVVGDRLLVAVAQRLESCARPGDTVARLGGDEFAILVTDDIHDIGDAARVAQRVEEALAPAVEIEGREIFTSASIGIAMSETGYASPEEVLRDADTAMYRAKGGGRARYEVFDEAMRERVLAGLQMDTDLRRALARDQLRVLYQPILSLVDGRVVGFEALLRWQHPQRGLVLPEDFVPAAEETGLILPIGEWVLERACRQLRAWDAESGGPFSFYVSVNLSARQLLLPDLAGVVRRILAETPLPAERLKLEITESTLVQNPEDAVQILGELKRMGVRLCLDDFGKGQSSMSYLHRFRLDALKIDQSFVGLLDRSGGSAEIVRSIVLLAHSLGLEVVGEGVETLGQRDSLRALGCDFVQGFLFSAPVPGEEALDQARGVGRRPAP